MAQKGKRKPQKPSNRVDLGAIFRAEVIGMLLLLVALLTLLSLAQAERGTLTKGWIDLLELAVGWGAWLMPLWFAAGGLWLVFVGLGRQLRFDPEQPYGALATFLLALSLLHLLAGTFGERTALDLAKAGEGGGYVGYGISRLLIASLGTPAAILVLVTMAVISLMLLFGTSLPEMWTAMSGAARQIWASRRRLPHISLPGRNSMPSLSGSKRSRADLGREVAPITGSTAARPSGSLFPRVIGAEQVWQLPPIGETLINAAERELSQSEIRDRVRVIEDTLNSFGVPAKVVEVNRGPTITQFGVEPGYLEKRNSDGRTVQAKVKVSKIEGLSNDLALALAASPIRIEAPVPGRSVVGIEVPNSEVGMVSLRSVLESEAFRQLNGPLPIALGQDVAGNPIATDLASMPHLLIAGATGSGKSVCINAIIASLLCSRTPDELQFILIDPKMVELTQYNGIPHLRAPVVIDLERVVSVLSWATREMDTRYKTLNKARARNVEAYNQQLTGKGEKALPYIVVVIDELADLMMVAPDEVERSICRLAQMARATGIHLVVATQSPRVDVVTGLIKANFPARISFAVTSQVDSRVIIDSVGADKLLGRGDMLFMAPDSSKLQRLQGCFVSDKELAALVGYWKGVRLVQEPVRPEAIVQQQLWDEIQSGETQAAHADELLPRAVAIVQEQKRASVSMLQRRLRIGYSRAARLVEVMEQQGIVGSDPGGGHSREVLVPSVSTVAGEGDGLPPL